MGVPPGMPLEPVGRVAGRPERCCVGMALLATEGRLDFVVAHQAVGHPRHVGLRCVSCLLKPPMACSAGVLRVQAGASRTGVAEIFAGVNSGRNGRRNVAQRQVELVIEPEIRDLRKRARRGSRVTIDAAGARFAKRFPVREPWCAHLRRAETRRYGKGLKANRNGAEVSQSLGYPLYVICQILLPPSSETRREPSGNCNSPTGRPQTSRRLGDNIHPVRKSCGPPLGFPSWNGTKATE